MTGDRPSARIAAAVESPYGRHPEEGTTTELLLADAFVPALVSAGLERDGVDGLGVASFTHTPDRAIEAGDATTSKRLVYESWGRDLPAGLAREGDAVFQLLSSGDLREGFQAFHEKRAARFTGR